MSAYFSFFPLLVYANTATINILAKVKFEESVSKRLANFYPYTLQEGERADQVAETYYEDSSLDWLVYMSNSIVDPYHEWPKASKQLDQYVTLKYGSIANAQLQTAFYRTDFTVDDSVISPAAYNALSTNLKQFWDPIVSYNDVIINYERRQNEIIVETNKIVQLGGTFGTFNETNIIKQSNTVMGTVAFANTTQVVIKHVLGTWTTSTPVLYGLTNAVANATITSVSTISQPIANNEIPYWSAVSYYDVEQENNEASKNIRLVNSAYVELIERDMRDLLST
jgi:hypothetical protein